MHASQDSGELPAAPGNGVDPSQIAKSRTPGIGDFKRLIEKFAARTMWLDGIVAIILFSATAGVVLWQNSRLSVLWDLSYALDSSVRMALGQMPYRDFPFVHPPLTFLIQAAIIKLAGPTYWPHIAYCAVVGGLSTVAAWRIALNVLRERLTHSRLIAFLLSVPLVPLGVYSVFPQPFYDPDCAAAILASLLLLQGLDRPEPSLARAFAAGVSIVIPVFIKQNMGLPFLGAVIPLLVLLAGLEIFKRRSPRRYLWCIAGAAFAAGAILLSLQLAAGLDNYWYWTMQFAAERRLPGGAQMLGIFADNRLAVWFGLFVLGASTIGLNRGRDRGQDAIGAAAMSAPFVWAALWLLLDDDLSEQTVRLLGVWPFVLLLSALVPVFDRGGPARFSRALPIALVAAVLGTLMSQQLWGSTYAIWPFLIVLMACILSALTAVLDAPAPWMSVTVAALVSVSLLAAGTSYVVAHERLDYSQLDEGPLRHATLPQLRGLSLRGRQLPDFEELVRYSEKNIPRGDGVVLIPGEDPFYFATGRTPKFPVLLFDRTTNPFSVDELVRQCLERNIRWLIVKQKLQNLGDSVEHRDRLMASLMRFYAPAARIHNYTVYRLRPSSHRP